MNKRKISVLNARPGMVLGEDVYTENNIMIINSGTKLNHTIISRLHFYSIPYIVILSSDSTSPDNVDFTNKNEFSATISTHPPVQSKEFIAFHNHYDEIMSEYKFELNKIVQQASEIDTHKLLKEPKKLLTESRNGIHLFDMLHNMRDYDDSTFAHGLNVSLIATIIGQWVHLSEEELSILTLGGLLHDIGKLLIPKEIITKPGKLTSEEYTIMKDHSKLGYELLQQCGISSHIKNCAYMHHERCDGSGYPNGLSVSQIDKFSKIISIADVYDAMTSNRCYRKGICPFKVIQLFEQEGLLKYDPKYLLPFLAGVVQTYIHNTVRLNNGLEGEVVLINAHALSKPIIKYKNKFIDLSILKDTYIEEII